MLASDDERELSSAVLLLDEGTNLARGSPVGRRPSPRGGRGELANAALQRGRQMNASALHRWSSAPRSKLRTRSASPARPVSTMIGSSGSIREASPSAARTRSRTSSPLPPSSRRSSSTRQGRRTSIARSPSAALEALDTRNPSAARLSARKPWWPRRPRSRGSAPARPHPKKDCAGEARPGCTGVGGCCEPASGRNDKKNGRRERGR
jgi:hypothetical protein